MPFQIAHLVGAVVATLMVTGFSFGYLESLVGRQVGLFVLFQIARPVGAVIAAMMVTIVHLGPLVGRQVDLFV